MSERYEGSNRGCVLASHLTVCSKARKEKAYECKIPNEFGKLLVVSIADLCLTFRGLFQHQAEYYWASCKSHLHCTQCYGLLDCVIVIRYESLIDLTMKDFRGIVITMEGQIDFHTVDMVEDPN